MATLVFTALGSVLGGPIFAAAGALAGGALDLALAGGGGNREGPRLSQLAVTTSSYGDPLARQFGRMRVPGTVIWATDLIEQSQTSGGGKGRPSVTTYSYSCSFAVALGSRAIARVGRIWADGNLLRGGDGALKVGGSIRVHSGTGDQAPDPLIAAAEGSALCPAWRGTAYVVFEDLQLADFGNRIPALSFEVVAEEGPLDLAGVLDGIVEDLDTEIALEGMIGFSVDGTPADLLATLAPIYPLSCDVSGDRLAIAPEFSQATPLVVGEPTTAFGQGDFGRNSGFARQRMASSDAPPRALRFYDPDRDFQTGMQRTGGRPLAGQPRTIEVPAAFGSADAQRLITRAASGDGWRRETLQWRTAELDPAVSPGSLVAVPGQAGIWRVLAWEWRDSGVELSLERANPLAFANGVANSGRANLAADLPQGESALVAFELPWDGSGNGDIRQVYAAVSSAAAGWSGAELSRDAGDGALVPLGPSGRRRSTIGTVLDTLPAGLPFCLARNSSVRVALLGTDMALTDATVRQLAAGQNRAFIGAEIVQFARAVPLGDGVWRISGLLRGRGGTEGSMVGHVSGEPFVLLDGAMTSLDPGTVGDAPGTRIAAVGLADAHPVSVPITGQGTTLRPLSPVHPRAVENAGGLSLSWTRRARGAWQWLDGVDAPLNEQVERYEVSCNVAGAVTRRWTVDMPALTIDAIELAGLRTSSPGGALLVRQQGTHAFSAPLQLYVFD